MPCFALAFEFEHNFSIGNWCEWTVKDVNIKIQLHLKHHFAISFIFAKSLVAVSSKCMHGALCGFNLNAIVSIDAYDDWPFEGIIELCACERQCVWLRFLINWFRDWLRVWVSESVSVTGFVRERLICFTNIDLMGAQRLSPSPKWATPQNRSNW